MAPPLPDLLRQILEGRKIQNETIDDFLARNKSLRRYSSSFNMLWAVLEQRGVSPPKQHQMKLQMPLCKFSNTLHLKLAMLIVQFYCYLGLEGECDFTLC